MDPKYVAGVIGTGIGTTIVTILQKFPIDWRGIFKPSSDGPLRIKAKWQAMWYKTDGDKETLFVEDTVDVKRTYGSKFDASGRTDDAADYEIEGRYISTACITFLYQFPKDGRDIRAGSGALAANADFTKLTGFWSGYTRENRIVNGRVVWTRIQT